MSFSYASVADRMYSRRCSELYDNIAYLHHPSGVTVVVLRNVRNKFGEYLGENNWVFSRKIQFEIEN